MTKEITKAHGTALSTEVDIMDDILSMAGEGTSYDSSEMQIPFVRVAQSLSPQLKKNKPEFIEGLSNGDIYNNLTGQFWPGDKGINVLPCYQVTKYLSFRPREAGGGFMGEIAADDPVLSQTVRNGSKEILPNGNELVKSDQHFCLIVDEDGMTQPVVIDMKSTQLKVSRRWKTMIAMNKVKHPATGRVITPPLFATLWSLRTVEESNDKGDFFNYAVEKVGLLENRDLLMEAKAFRESVARGEVRAQSEAAESPAAGGGGYGSDDDIPF